MLWKRSWIVWLALWARKFLSFIFRSPSNQWLFYRCTPGLSNQGALTVPAPNAVLPTQNYSQNQNNNVANMSPVSNTTNSWAISYPQAVDKLNKSTRKFSVLPPPEVLAIVIDVYFSRCHNQPYSFFHEKNFRIRLIEGMIPDYLLFAVLATGLRFSKDPYFHGELHEASISYARESWRQIVSAWFATESDPDIQICQAITLLSVVDFTGNFTLYLWATYI